MMMGGGGALPDEPMLDTSYRSAPQLPSTSAQLLLSPPPLGMAIAAGPHMTTDPHRTSTEAAVDPETSLHTLTESLDEDAISFITSMKYS
jgi:hypothetical protein